MGLAEEIEKLHALRNSGALSDQEFARAKEQLLRGDTPAAGNGQNVLRAFRRSAHDRWLGGVCGDALLMLPAMMFPLSGLPLIGLSLLMSQILTNVPTCFSSPMTGVIRLANSLSTNTALESE